MMIGTQVPWNAAWTGEDGGYEILRCRFAGDRPALWQPFKPGTGKPMFAEPHIVRQRRSIWERRCTVCGEKTPPDDRWWFEHGTFHDRWYMTTEAPVHRACADHSMSVCPHLRGRAIEPRPFPDGAVMLAATIRPDSLMKLYGLRASADVIGQMKLAFHRERIVSSI